MNFVSCNIFCSPQFIVHGKSCLSKVEVGNFATFGLQLPELSLNFLTGLVNDCVKVFVELVCCNKGDLEFGESWIIILFKRLEPRGVISGDCDWARVPDRS